MLSQANERSTQDVMAVKLLFLMNDMTVEGWNVLESFFADLLAVVEALVEPLLSRP